MTESTRSRVERWPWIATSLAAAVALLLTLGWAFDRTVLIDVAWLTAWGSRLQLVLDPLGAPLAVFCTALLVPILVYGAGYLPLHLQRSGQHRRAQVRFYALMLAFSLAMVLLILAADLLVVFVALELTALTSFLLIGFDRTEESNRAAAVALVVTVGSSLLFLVGALLVASQTGTTSVAELRDLARTHEISTPALACLAAGVLGKSAQVPLHFWLPRAMKAPTPVSAYLHSATLVAAGVFVLQRLRFLLEGAPEVLLALQIVGVGSILLGATMAIVSDGLKRILAYSTVAQYGYAVVLISLSGDHAWAGAPLFIVAHGLCKCGLFMMVGCVSTAAGVDELSESHGVLRTMPMVAVTGAIAAAGLVGLPVTVGFFKDDLFLSAAHEHGPALAVVATVAVCATVIYTGRLWLGLFGRKAAEARSEPLPWPMTAALAFVAVLIVVGGAWTSPLASAFSKAGTVVAGQPVSVELAYHFDLQQPVTWMTVTAWSVGVGALVLRRRWQGPVRKVVEAIADRVGPSTLAEHLIAATGAISNAVHRLERRDLRDRITAVLVPTAVLVVLGLIAANPRFASVTAIEAQDVPVLAGLVVTSAAALAAARQVEHLAMVLVLSFVGFGLALTLALGGAPDVALILVLVETVITILFVAVLSNMRREILRRACERSVSGSGVWTGILAGGAAFMVAWSALSASGGPSVATDLIAAADKAHAKDVVTAILADFRGLDTAGEVTAFAVAILGAGAISWGRQS